MKSLLSILFFSVLLQIAPARAAVVTVDRVVAVVNRSPITRQELDERIASIRKNLSRQGIQAPAADILESEALQRMITERVMLEQANNLGIRVDDGLLEGALSRIAQQNKLSLSELRKRLESDGTNWRSFSDDIRKEITLSQLREREIENKILVTEAEVDDFLRLNANKPNMEYRIAQIMVGLPENASPEQIQEKRVRIIAARQELGEGKDFGAVAATYSTAAEAANGGLIGWRATGALAPAFADMLEKLKAGEITDIVRSGTGLHIFKLLEKREQTDKQIVRQTHARHILIRTNEVVSEIDAHNKLTQIRDRLLNGGKFEDLARQYSNDTSASNGGDLGWLSSGETVPEFEQAMNQLKPGDISEPIKSPFGLHLIQVQERRDYDATQENQRMKARQDLRQRKAEEQYDDWIRQLRDKAYISIRLKDE